MVSICFLPENLHPSLKNHAKDLSSDSISEAALDLNEEPTTTALLSKDMIHYQHIRLEGVRH